MCNFKKRDGNDFIINSNTAKLSNFEQAKIKYKTMFDVLLKYAKVIPIKKPGKPENEVRGYRPISLLSSISILERILLRRTNDYHEENKIIPD